MKLQIQRKDNHVINTFMESKNWIRTTVNEQAGFHTHLIHNRTFQTRLSRHKLHWKPVCFSTIHGQIIGHLEPYKKVRYGCDCGIR